jgi:chromosome segregation ATPase
VSDTDSATKLAAPVIRFVPSPEQVAADARSAAREERRKELAARAREKERVDRAVRELVAERKELDEAPRKFEEQLMRKQRELSLELSRARAAAGDAASAAEELVQDYVPAELRTRRARLEAARNDALAACRGTQEDVRSLHVQVEQYKQASGDALGLKKIEQRLAAREADLKALLDKAEEAQRELTRAEDELGAAIAAAMA